MLDMIKERRWMQYTIALLVILNLAMVTSMFLHERSSHGPQGPQGPKNGLEYFLKTELDLFPEQVEQMHIIRREHFRANQPLVHALKDSSELLILLAFNPDADSSLANKLSLNIGDIHAQLDFALYSHFVQLNSICTPVQKERLRALAKELTRGSVPPPNAQHQPGGGPPPPGGGPPPPRNK
ncbi:hypothetical protein HQ531_00205 [bacterium]|nr:hypothetical protein [bacterium]